MNVITKKLSKDLDTIEVLPLADWHLGDSHCNIDNIKEQVKYIQDHENVFCILNGDLLNNATKTSVSDIYSEYLSPMTQIKHGVELLSPIKNKILAITSGNHEKRTYKKEGLDLMEVVSRELGLGSIFSQGAIFLFLYVGKDRRHKNEKDRQIMYTFYINHGSGGGRKEGAKAIRLADMSSIADADIYIHSHTHLPMIMKQGYYRTDVQHNTLINVTKLFVNTASSLNYGGYGEEYEYKPNSIDSPKILLSGAKKDFTAIL